MGPEGKHVPGLELPSLGFRKAVCVRLSPTVLFARKEHCQGYHRMSIRMIGFMFGLFKETSHYGFYTLS